MNIQSVEDNPDHVYHQPEAQRLHFHQRARRPAEYPIWCIVTSGGCSPLAKRAMKVFRIGGPFVLEAG